MKHICLIILLIPVIALSSQWETFSIRNNGTIPIWTVAGPFPNANLGVHGQGCFGYFKDYLVDFGGEKKAVLAEGDVVKLAEGKEIGCKTAFSDGSGLLDYIEIFGVNKETPAVAYAFCQLAAPKKQNVILKIRSNDGVMAWLNQQMIHDHHVGRTIESGEDQIPVTLEKGNNRLLVKVDQGGGNWGLVLAVVDLNGQPVQNFVASVSTKNPVKGRIQSVNLQTTSLILKTDQGDRQVINGEIFSGGVKKLTGRISKAEWQKSYDIQLENIAPGKHEFQIKVPVITETGPARVQLESSHDRLELPELILQKPRQWFIYLVQHTHTDIGYTRPQTEILPEHLRYIDYALDFCDLTDNYPDDAKFRWTCEVSWPVSEYLKRRPPEQIDRLKKQVDEGRIEITGMYLNMSDIATENALAASLQPIRDFKMLDFPVKSAMQNDVNGIGWCLVDYFSDIEVKYLTMGINKTRSVLPFDKPTTFWWESPAGKRVLAFRADHYHTANYWKLHVADLEFFEPSLIEYLNLLAETKYPFDRIAVQYSGYHTDNSPPSTKACDLVKAWNEKYVWPKLRIATASEFLEFVEQTYANQLPVYRVAWPDWWTDGSGSAAKETAEARRIHNAIQLDQGLLSIAAISGAKISAGILDRVNAIQDALLFYDEHTFGAAESISDPMAENSVVQWGEKSAYVWEAVKNEGLLREEILGLLQPFIPRARTSTIVVFNTLGWLRSGLVELFIDHEILPNDAQFNIVDNATGESVLVQPKQSRTEGTYWWLWAKDVPPLGYKTFRIEVKDEKQMRLPATRSKTLVLENNYYRIELDAQAGAVKSLCDKEMALELVDQNCPWQFGQLIYETLRDGRDFKADAFERQSLTNVNVEGVSEEAIWKSLQISGDMEGCEKNHGVKIEIRLYKTEKRIEFLFGIRKQRQTNPEACYVAFPFTVPDAKIVYEAQGGFVTPGKTQLPGSSSDWHAVQNFVAIRNGQSQIILGSSQVPLVQFGDINLGKWQYVANIEQPHVYSWVMNNYWFTNFKAFQEGEFKWSYFLTSHRDTTNHFATQFSWNSCTPLIARAFPSGGDHVGKTALSVLNLTAPNLLLVNVKPAVDDKALILHLREVEGKVASFSINNSVLNEKLKSVDQVNVLEQTIISNATNISFKPYEVKFLRLNF